MPRPPETMMSASATSSSPPSAASDLADHRADRQCRSARSVSTAAWPPRRLGREDVGPQRHHDRLRRAAVDGGDRLARVDRPHGDERAALERHLRHVGQTADAEARRQPARQVAADRGAGEEDGIRLGTRSTAAWSAAAYPSDE